MFLLNPKFASVINFVSGKTRDHSVSKILSIFLQPKRKLTTALTVFQSVCYQPQIECVILINSCKASTLTKQLIFNSCFLLTKNTANTKEVYLLPRVLKIYVCLQSKKYLSVYQFNL